jgi:hypothetical protein
MQTLPTGGFTWTAAGAWASFLALLGIIVRQIGPWRKQSIDAEHTFREGLLKRVERLERTLERERIRHNAERSIDRHRLNNITQCFDAMLLLIETNPEKASEIVVKIKDMRAAQMKAEAEEKAIIRAAEIEADDCESDHDGN